MADEGMSAAAREMVERSCRVQGIAVKVRDPVALARIAVLLATDAHPEAGRYTLQTGAMRVGSKRLSPRTPGPITA